MAELDKLNKLKSGLAASRNFYQREMGKRDQILKSKESLIRDLIEKTEEEQVLRMEREVLDKASERGKIESAQTAQHLVNQTLKYVFDEDIEFKINISNPAGQPNMDFETEVTRGGQRISREPVEGGGLGVVDVLSTALRILGLNVIDRENGAPMVFDEPGKSVSEQYQERMAEYLKQTSISFGRQIFLVTHNKESLGSIGDKTFLVEMDQNQVSSLVEL